MNLFYEPSLATNLKEIFLNEQESRHAVKVLRYDIGDTLHLTDGKGHFYQGILAQKTKKHCRVSIEQYEEVPESGQPIDLAFSPLKNRNRMEWVIEKATELGVSSITFLHTKNTERTKVNPDRVDRIVISALKQSFRAYKPTCFYGQNFNAWLKHSDFENKTLLMAECETPEKPYLPEVCPRAKKLFLLFGPEGDLAPAEIESAKEAGFQAVSLGSLRLRTETAIISGLAMVNAVNLLKS